MPEFVAYYRVSTDRQGRSGLGLEAQQQAVHACVRARGGVLVAEFTEVETGKGSNALHRRPELRAALAHARSRKATLVIAKLDRLARNVAFIAQLMDSDVDFIAVDHPTANRLTLHILAAVAEHEREMISERTKAALAAAKARGTTLGANGRRLAAANQAAAQEALAPLASTFTKMLAEGGSIRAMAQRLNDQGVQTPAGGRWHVSNLHKALKRLALA